MNYKPQFNKDVKDCVKIANQFSLKFNKSLIEPADLLYALLDNPSFNSFKVIKNYGLNVEQIKNFIINSMKEIYKDNQPSSTKPKSKFSQSVKAVFELSSVIASNKKEKFVDTVHLLLALVDVDDELINKILKKFNITKEGIEKLLLLPNLVSSSEKKKKDKYTIFMPSSIANMADKFSPSLRQVIQLAKEEAIRYKNNYIDIEHILLAMLRVIKEQELTIPSIDIEEINIDEIRKTLEPKFKSQYEDFTGRLSFTVRTSKAFDLAIQEAYLLRSKWIDVKHLLLGLLGFEKGIVGEILKTDLAVTRGAIIERTQIEVISDECNLCPSIDLSKYKVDRSITNLIPKKIAQEFKVFPIHQRKNIITVATSKPYNENLKFNLQNILNKNIIFIWADPAIIELYLREYY